MFNYDNIPDIKIEDIVSVSNHQLIKNMPKTLIEFCKSVENDDMFYFHHTSLFIGSKTVQSFHNQIYTFLESIDAVEYSINDSLHNACLPMPLAITFRNNYKFYSNHKWIVGDISDVYNLKSGKLWLPPHHKAKVTQLGKVPETVAEILRGYIKYVLKCKDKDFEELKIELQSLENAGVLTEKFYEEIKKGLFFVEEEKQKQ